MNQAIIGDFNGKVRNEPVDKEMGRYGQKMKEWK